jgi:hypothetical protein
LLHSNQHVQLAIAVEISGLHRQHWKAGQGCDGRTEGAISRSRVEKDAAACAVAAGLAHHEVELAIVIEIADRNRPGERRDARLGSEGHRR